MKAKNPDNFVKSNRWIFGVVLAFSIFSLIAAFVLTIEKFVILQNPDAQLSCSFNLVLNCAQVMNTPQASAFGFPNSLIGLMAYPVLITVAVAALSGMRFGKKFMFAAQIGVTLGLIFAYWLFFQSVYVIQILCPWCLVVTFSTTLIFEAFLRYNLHENNLYLPKNAHKKALTFIQKDYDKLLIAAWLVLMATLVYLQFGNMLFS